MAGPGYGFRQEIRPRRHVHRKLVPVLRRWLCPAICAVGRWRRASASLLAAVQILPTWELGGMGPRARHDLPRSLWELAFSRPIRRRRWLECSVVEVRGAGRRRGWRRAFAKGLSIQRRTVALAGTDLAQRMRPAIPDPSSLGFRAAERRPHLDAESLLRRDRAVLAFGGWRLRGSDPRLRCCWWMTLWAVLAGLGEYGLGWLAQELAIGPVLVTRRLAWEPNSAGSIG